MELLTADLNIRQSERVFRYSSWHYLWIFVVTVVISVVALILFWAVEFIEAVYIVGPALSIYALINLIIFFRSLRPDNWVLAIADDGIKLKYRSSMNKFESRTEPAILAIKWSELEFATWLHKMRISKREPSFNYEKNKYIVLKTKAEIPEEIIKAIKKKSPGKTRVSFVHRPVEIEGRFMIYVLWSGMRGAVSIAPEKVLKLLGPHVKILWDQRIPMPSIEGLLSENDKAAGNISSSVSAEDREKSIKLAQYAYGLSRTDAEKYVEHQTGKVETAAGDEVGGNLSVDDDILREARAGRKIEAIKMARAAYGIGLAEAKEYVENLERDR